MENFIFRGALPEDFGEMRRLCDERYGAGYLTRRVFERYTRVPELFIAAQSGDEYAGFAVMVPASEEEVAGEMKMPPEDVKELSGGKPPLIFRSLVIQKRFEKMGLPFAMSNILLERAAKAGYGTLFGPAWAYEGKVPIENLLNKLGFTPLYVRKNVWYDDLRYRCVICGGRCRCDAVIFFKKLDNTLTERSDDNAGDPETQAQ